MTQPQPLLTPQQSRYVRWLLTRRAAGDTVESLASALVDSQVHLNPHQAEAALFACRNPLARGVILAKEEHYRLWLADPLALYGVENAKLAPGYQAPAAKTSRKG
jgi:hypothetical protein